MGQLDGSVALVTGAASGIGQAIARLFAEEGARVAALDLQPAEGVDLALVADVRDEHAVARAVERTTAELGPPDVLVNSAGILSHGFVHEMPLAQWQEAIDVNLTGVFLCCRAVLPGMIERRRGRIVNISSQLGLRGAERFVHYSASKAGVIGLTRALAWEVAPHGITVNAIAPGPIDTPMTGRVPREWLKPVLEQLPLHRLGRPEEIAPTALLLASAGGGYYTGATLNVSGGDVMY